MPRLQLEGASLYYEVHGEGPWLVFAHGAGGNTLSWWQQVPTFAPHHRCVVYDQRGWGRSTCEAPPDPDAFAGDLAALLDHLGVERGALVGQSMGGWTVLGCALLRPRRLTHLALAGTLAGVTDDDMLARLARFHAEGGGLVFDPHKALAPDFPVREPALTLLYDQISGFYPPVGQEFLMRLTSLRYSERVTELSMPVRFIAGAHDQLFPPDIVRSACAKVPGAELVLLPEAGHSGYFECAEEFNGALASLLGDGRVTLLADWNGKVTVITGASSGIGRLLAERVAVKGARVALVARRLPLLDEVAGQIRDAGGEALAVACDVARRDEVFSAVERVREHFGRIDVLVNNAGYGGHRRFVDWDLDDIERMLQVNFLGSVYWTKAVLPHLIARRSGWIVFMASVAGRIGVPDESVYVASKFAIVGLAEALSSEVEDAGVHVLTVCPGAIDTPFFDDEALARMPRAAKRRMIGPQPVVDAVLDALARGSHDVTVPRSIAAGYIVRALAPEFMRRQVKKSTIG